MDRLHLNNLSIKLLERADWYFENETVTITYERGQSSWFIRCVDEIGEEVSVWLGEGPCPAPVAVPYPPPPSPAPPKVVSGKVLQRKGRSFRHQTLESCSTLWLTLLCSVFIWAARKSSDNTELVSRRLSCCPPELTDQLPCPWAPHLCNRIIMQTSWGCWK